MKRVFVCLVVALMVALGPVGTGYALSDAEYREMVQTSDEFPLPTWSWLLRGNTFTDSTRDRQRKTCCRNSVDG